MRCCQRARHTGTMLLQIRNVSWLMGKDKRLLVLPPSWYIAESCLARLTSVPTGYFSSKDKEGDVKITS